MSEKTNKEYPIEIDPNILELLGPSLYTNIYYILSELIANAWDADAKNVWINVKSNSLTVEDDGHGMSYDNNEISKYLSVAKETRTTELEAQSKKLKRPKMGRKGIGKLSALAVSEKVNVMTISQGEKSGFILSRSVPENKKLEPIQNEDIQFAHIVDNGTKIEMLDPEYSLPKTAVTFKRNLVKFFPNVGNDFKVIIKVNEGDEVVLDSFSDTVVPQFDTLTIFGNESDYFSQIPENISEEFKIIETPKIKVNIKNKKGLTLEVEQNIKGWIGTYKSIRGHKKDSTDFSMNFLAIYSHGKLGEFNILDSVGTNRTFDNYIVGQIFIECFEDTNFPDMALSNRQGYKKDDPRYIEMIKWAENAVRNSINLKIKAVDKEKGNKKRQENQRKIDFENDLKKNVDSTVNDLKKYIKDKDKREKISKALQSVGTKIIQSKKDTKKVLISQTYNDEKLNNCIYELLKYNGFSSDEIIYSNSVDDEARLPVDVGIYDYLREFFVKSISDKEIYVFYIISDSTVSSHGVLMEQGAGWIVQTKHSVIKSGQENPKEPLDTRRTWTEIRFKDDEIFCTELSFGVLYQMIKDACDMFSKTMKSKEENMKFFCDSFGEILSKSEFSNRVN